MSQKVKLGGPIPCSKCGLPNRPGTECVLCNDTRFKEPPKRLHDEVYLKELYNLLTLRYIKNETKFK